MAFLSMYFSARAALNPGVIITIWSVNPLYMAVMDYFLFGQRLHWHHHAGLFSIVISIVLLSLTGIVDPVVPGS